MPSLFLFVMSARHGCAYLSCLAILANLRCIPGQRNSIILDASIIYNAEAVCDASIIDYSLHSFQPLSSCYVRPGMYEISAKVGSITSTT